MGDENETDIQWVDGSDLQLKPGLFNWVASLFGGGEYAESLGTNVLVAYGGASSDNGVINEEVNSATFELYLESNTDGPAATLSGNTIPADQSKYATVAAGLMKAELSTYKKNPALLINNGGKVNAIGNNPNPTATYYGQPFADEIYFHAGNKYRESLTTRTGRPISAGCFTGSHGNRQVYLNFMNNFTSGWKGNLYLSRK